MSEKEKKKEQLTKGIWESSTYTGGQDASDMFSWFGQDEGIFLPNKDLNDTYLVQEREQGRNKKHYITNFK